MSSHYIAIVNDNLGLPYFRCMVFIVIILSSDNSLNLLSIILLFSFFSLANNEYLCNQLTNNNE